MKNTNAGLGDWVSFEKLAEEYPTFPVRTLRYLSRAEVRKENGFDHCIRLVTARKFVVSLSRFAVWIEGLPVDYTTVGGKFEGLNMSGKRIGKLLTVDHVATEYRRVYREARNGELDMKKAKGLAWMLKELAFLIRTTDIERRLEALESAESVTQ